MIFNYVKPSALQNWVATNAAGSLKTTPGDSWRAYLAANGGTGQTIADMECSWLVAVSATGSDLYDKWQSYLAANGGTGGGKNAFQSKYQ